MGFVDTNIFIEEACRDGVRSDKCHEMLKTKVLWTTGLVLSEVEWVMRSIYETRKEVICNYLGVILESTNIKIPGKRIYKEALELFRDMNVDWVDCVNYLKAKKKGIKVAISYDKHFNKFEGIERKEP